MLSSTLKHFSHPEHFLRLEEENFIRDDAKCYVCDKSVIGFPTYTCTNHCYTDCKNFYLHKSCAELPAEIIRDKQDSHPLTLLPRPDNYFCDLCNNRIFIHLLFYYINSFLFLHDPLTKYPFHICRNEIEANDNIDSEPDFVQFPLPVEESLLDLIITHCSKLQTVIRAEGQNGANDPRIIREHWSHREHPLEMQQFTFSENELPDNDDDDDKRVLICDGCIQPITSSHVSYYACTHCRFLLHSFCATKLPRQLPVGACPFHPHHSFKLNKVHRFYDFFICGVCGYCSNGFYYKCEACHIKIEIRCAFLPTRIKHKSHKRHSLVQQRCLVFDKICSASRIGIDGGSLVYACETCSNFQIFVGCAFYPSRMKHKYDDHPITLRQPPFFYEGVLYCQICEEQLNNQMWLYHCDECGHSFHFTCFRSTGNVKIGGTIKYSIGNQPHTLTLVLKMTIRNKSSPYLCAICGQGYKFQYFFECYGCGYLACIFCIRGLHVE